MPSDDYPPPRHLLRRLGLVLDLAGDREGSGWLGHHPTLADAAGGIRIGLLATLVDVVGGTLAVRVTGGRSATADLSIVLARPAEAPAVEARARVLRSGSTTLVVAVDLYPAPGPGRRARRAPLGSGTMTFSLLPRRPGDEPPPVGPGGPPRRARFGALDLEAPVADEAGLGGGGAGPVPLAVTDELRNSFGAVQGGVLALLADEAACRAAQAALGPAACLGLHLAYLAPGRDGPLRAEAALAGRGPRRTARVTTTDPSGGYRVVTVAHAEVLACGAPR